MKTIISTFLLTICLLINCSAHSDNPTALNGIIRAEKLYLHNAISRNPASFGFSKSWASDPVVRKKILAAESLIEQFFKSHLKDFSNEELEEIATHQATDLLIARAEKITLSEYKKELEPLFPCKKRKELVKIKKTIEEMSSKINIPMSYDKLFDPILKKSNYAQTFREIYFEKCSTCYNSNSSRAEIEADADKFSELLIKLRKKSIVDCRSEDQYSSYLKFINSDLHNRFTERSDKLDSQLIIFFKNS